MTQQKVDRSFVQEDRDAYREYGRFTKNSLQQVVVARKRLLVQGEWQDFLDVRVWYRTISGDAYNPGKGVTIRADLSSDLERLVNKAVKDLNAQIAGSEEHDG